MEDLENSSPATPDSTVESDLQDQVKSLQKLLNYTLVLTIIVAGAVTLFLRRQANLTKAELQILRPQKAQIDAQYKKLVGPDVEAFGRKLAEYGVTHPDFQPIMRKYGLGKPTVITGAAPTRATSPATGPAVIKK